MKKEMIPFEATKKSSNNLKNCTMPLLQSSSYQWKQRGLIQPQYYLSQNSETDWLIRALIDMRQYYKHHWKAVLNLINNSLIDCAGTNSGNFTMILNFCRSKSHSFQNPKKTGLPGFFSATRNPGFKILSRIANTAQMHGCREGFFPSLDFDIF